MDNHRYYGVNVKVLNLPEVSGEDKLREAIGDHGIQVLYDGVAEGFWHSLSNEAEIQGGVEAVYAEGRSGGWAVPHPAIDPEEEPARFAKFAKLAEDELDYFTNTVWREAVTDRLHALESQREANIVRGTH